MTDLTPPPDAARIAEKLTAAQRAVLLGRDNDPSDRFDAICAELCGLGILFDGCSITPLGIAVRALVKP